MSKPDQNEELFLAAYVRTGISFMEKKEWEKACNSFCKALQVESRDPSIFKLRARTFLAMNLYQLALVDTELALELEPNDAEGLFLKAECIFALQSYAHAAVFYQRACDMSNNPEYKEALDRCIKKQQEDDPKKASRKKFVSESKESFIHHLFPEKKYMHLLCDTG
eukprot:TRINITY_DN203_c0_g1_i2.p1 TRINITY_DN203_c0_g1~~TRINITY_DN203_c0_g1_i2.p1  ORF type:complete len:166 (+),score=40.01 TRINITY_DN203_c0_g1_i2:206-703(+)